MTRSIHSPPVLFYLSTDDTCSYLPGRRERKVFAYLDTMAKPASVFDRLTQEGFRRSQGVIYRPACHACRKCLSARVRTDDFSWRKRHRQAFNRNRDLNGAWVANEPTEEQFALFRAYLRSRHLNAGMDDMTYDDFAEMISSSVVDTRICEYRDVEGRLRACVLSDELSDGRSLVYSFFDPSEPARSLGRFIILDQIRQLALEARAYLYLGYWVEGSAKMAYKSDYQPLEVLTARGWQDQTVVLQHDTNVGPILPEGNGSGQT